MSKTFSEHQAEMTEVRNAGLAPGVEQAIRRDERLRLGRSLDEHRDAVAAFTASNGRAVDLIAYLLRLDVRDDPEPTP